MNKKNLTNDFCGGDHEMEFREQGFSGEISQLLPSERENLEMAYSELTN